MPLSPRYGFQLIDVGTADKSFAVNAALTRMEARLGGWAKARNIATPPSTNLEGDLYIVPATGATGAFAGFANKVALFIGGIFEMYAPVLLERYRIANEGGLLVLWNGTAWVVASGSGGGITAVSQDPAPTLGGPLEGAGNYYRNLRAGTFSVTGTLTWAGWPRMLYRDTSPINVVLPKDAAAGQEFVVVTTTNEGIVTCTPESGATLYSGALGGLTAIAQCRTTGPRKKMVLSVESNIGSAAIWTVDGAHTS